MFSSYGLHWKKVESAQKLKYCNIPYSAEMTAEAFLQQQQQQLGKQQQ